MNKEEWEDLTIEAVQYIPKMINPCFEFSIKRMVDMFKEKWANIDPTEKEEAWKIFQSNLEEAQKSLDDRFAAAKAEIEDWGEINKVLKSIPEPFRGTRSDAAWDNLLDGLDNLAKKEEKGKLKGQQRRKTNRPN